MVHLRLGEQTMLIRLCSTPAPLRGPANSVDRAQRGSACPPHACTRGRCWEPTSVGRVSPSYHSRVREWASVLPRVEAVVTCVATWLGGPVASSLWGDSTCHRGDSWAPPGPLLATTAFDFGVLASAMLTSALLFNL
jgi:hypothetical protein